ncbi:MAG: hypothetical protein HY909_23980 [Deltaproteobacteria bacterium]|nr:hypothetical protein [Deltaproteobacteria bacterium]
MRRSAFALGLSLGLRAASALAGYPDVFGLGVESVARAGAGVADSTNFGAAWLNPAGLAFSPGSVLSLGGAFVGSGLVTRGRRVPIEDPFSSPGGLVLRIPGDRWVSRALAFGIGINALPSTLGHIVNGAPDAPMFPYYQNRTQRLVVLPAVALRPHPMLSLGVALNYYASLEGPAEAEEGPLRAVETTITQELRALTTVVLGVRFEPTARWSFGAVYRQRFVAPYAVRTRSNVGGIALDLAVNAEGLATPDEVALGARYRGDRWRLLVDAQWSRWSAWDGPFVRVSATLPGLALTPRSPSGRLQDTYALRLGGSLRAWQGATDDRWVELHAGLGVESSMVHEQPGRTNLLDGPRVLSGAGVTAAVPRPWVWGARFRVGLAVQVHALLPVTLTKRVGTPEEAARDPGVLADEDATLPGTQTRNPGYPTLTGGGFAYTITGGLEIDL